jgi:hypothetical protein
MSHWFDRLAVRAAGDDDDKRRLTRREAVAAAASGAAALSVLGSPFLSDALASPESCRCWQNAWNKFDKADDDLYNRTIRDRSAVVVPITGAVYVFGLAGLGVGTTLGAVYHCGWCSDDDMKKVGKPPPPNFTPCAHRGGRNFRDQCGGNNPPPPSEACPQGYTPCADTCCYPGDYCAACGICCVADVNCCP